MMELVF